MRKYSLFFLAIVLPLFCKERASGYPYLSGDSWRFFCDWVLSDEVGFDPRKVQNGDTVFVEYWSLKKFSRKVLPKIKAQFILITPNAENGSDGPLPGPFNAIAESPKVAAWFLQNIDRDPSEKLIPIPIGLANRIWDHGDIEILDQWIGKTAAKTSLAYVNFSLGTNKEKRGPCLKYFQNQPWVKVAEGRSFPEYLKDLTKTVFVISPPGNGLDCHRTWEALLMGCYPVVLSSTLDPLYENLPVVIVKDWGEVTEEFLREKERQFQLIKWSKKQLYADYWFLRVKKLQRNLREKWFYSL